VTRQLHRVIVDEAHLPLTASNYRPVLLRLRDLHAVGCPWSVMSATLPVVGMQELGYLLLMPNIQYVRQSANWPELVYCVIHLGRDESMAAAVKEVLRRERDKLVAVAPEAAVAWRAIIYCRLQRQCGDMARNTDAPCYDGSLSDEQRQCALNVWMTATDARHAVMFATTAFGAGVDCSGVRLVIHTGLSYSAMEYAQETGHAGRDGQAALCVALMPHSWRAPAAPAMRNSWHTADYQMLEALFGACAAPACRRQVLTAYLDGNAPGTSCDAATSQPCDVCRGNDEAMLEDATGAASLPPSYAGAGSPRT
jgi:superfamily II DNA helicase RecQ